jgi:glycosyltransferase involved in cell wall biosynthesis
MKIDLIFPHVPPKMDAIGQYTAVFARELSRLGHTVRIWIASDSFDVIDGVEIITNAFSAENPQSIALLLNRIAQDPPEHLILQYNPFSYGKYGKNLILPTALSHFKKAQPTVSLIIMFHERFTSFWYILDGKWLWQSSIMFFWQYYQFRQIGRVADHLWFSTEAWKTYFERCFPTKKRYHLSIPANMPLVPTTKAVARERLNIPPEVFVVGFFGTAHVSRMIPLMQKTMAFLQDSGVPAELLYIGPDKDEVCAGLKRPPLIAEGPLPEEEVSRRFAAMDLFLSPFIDGVSTRRTSMMTGLQHGIATLGTYTPQTDAMLLAEQEKSLVLTPVEDQDMFCQAALSLARETERRERIATAAQIFYDQHFDGSVLTARVIDFLRNSS